MWVGFDAALEERSLSFLEPLFALLHPEMLLAKIHCHHVDLLASGARCARCPDVESWVPDLCFLGLGWRWAFRGGGIRGRSGFWGWGVDLPFGWKRNVLLDLNLKGKHATETDGATCRWLVLSPVEGGLGAVDETALVCGVGWLACEWSVRRRRRRGCSPGGGLYSEINETDFGGFRGVESLLLVGAMSL